MNGDMNGRRRSQAQNVGNLFEGLFEQPMGGMGNAKVFRGPGGMSFVYQSGGLDLGDLFGQPRMRRRGN